MRNFIIEGTANTPKISLNHDDHRLIFEGDSRPEDGQNFFEPVLEWLTEYEKHLHYLRDQSDVPVEIICDFKFEYFNSSSAKYLLDIVDQLGVINTGADNVTLITNWYYDEMDDDMLEAGKEFERILDAEFNFIIVHE